MSTIEDTMYSKNNLDKMNHLRGDKALHDVLSTDGNKIYLLTFDSHLIVKKGDDAHCFFSHDDITSLMDGHEHRIFLGAKGNDYYFALSLSDFNHEAYSLFNAKEYAMRHVRPDDEMGVIGQAISILNWNKRHTFCGQCGGLTQSTCNGWRRDCLHCNVQHFPRVDSVVIMLVTRGDCCLLGSGTDFSDKRYSCLAGFMEPGETIEAAAARELYEEAGIQGGVARYMTSQPWPFPYSLMIGVHIETNQETITLDKEELKDAQWVRKSDVKAVLGGDTSRGFTLPPDVAIAHTLLMHWVNH
ncbi:MAG: NAD(+) diphosphatase [Coxiella sp. (in: Bacteria)]|nr:MAG: NAD(+) diphosphatase [Coxiella sp. (in: g-proteobacteria)]